MATPMPTPYRNFGSDIANEDNNADYLQNGVEDAKARLQSASEQYKASPGIQQENLRNKAAQDLVDRTNAVEQARTRARELEIQKKQAPSTTGTPTSSTTSGLSDLLKYAGNAMVPSAGAATLSEATGAPDFHPPMSTAPPQVPTQQAAQVVRGLRDAGVGKIGDKASVDSKDSSGTTTTRPLLLDENDIKTVGTAVRGTPEWEQQAKGLDDLENLVKLGAQRNANKSSIDLSPLGAYLDYQNTLKGKSTDIAKSLKGEPVTDTSLGDMSEIQRRRGDMAKELINTIKASKLGTVVDKDGNIVGYNGGVQPPRPVNPSAGANLNLRRVQALTRETDNTFKENDEAMKALNQAAERVDTNNPSAIASLPLVLEKMDSGSTRMMAAAIGMELKGGDASWPAQLRQGLQTMSTGTLSPHAQQVFKQRFQEAAVRAQQERDAKRTHLNSFADALGSTPEEKTQIVDSHYSIPVKGYPTASGMGAGAKPSSPEDEAAHMKMFLDMVKAHEAGK